MNSNTMNIILQCFYLMLFLYCDISVAFQHTNRGIFQNFVFKQKLSKFPKLQTKKDWSIPKPSDQSIQPLESIDNLPDERGYAYTVELPRVSGLSWGSDLSFRWIYVQDIDPNGAAAESNMIQKGDYIIGCGNMSSIALDFNEVLTIIGLHNEITNYTFFRGTKEQLLGRPVEDPLKTTYSITVKQKGKSDIVLKCPGGSNLRTVLVSNGINVYRSLTRWTNCSGKQRCGTCIVDVQEGGEFCSRRAIDEDTVLQQNPETYRLSCVTYVYSNITVEVQSPVGASQWTR